MIAATAVPWASTVLPKEARAGDGRQPAGSGPVGAEEGAQFLRVELGFFERREVPAARACVNRTRLVARSSHVRGARLMLAGNCVKPEGTSTRRACCAAGISPFARYIRIDEPMVSVSQ
ncbi:MAG TPA: hypothetical protein VGI96_20065 [Streptosporangiaceae bacterium]|jgi:hypothetical protein